jgi:hypothetical protein
MSDVPMDPMGAAGEQPSEEEIRAYLGQLREAPVDQVVAEVVSALLNAAQVKLGRRDARVLLDAMAAVGDTIRGVLPPELTDQVDEAVRQLRLAQVEAEQQVAAAAAQGHEEVGDLAVSADGGDSAASAAPEQPAPPRPDPTSRLWVPGR